MKVMIVDDEAFSIKLLSRQLEANGADSISGFISAQQALNVLSDQSESVDLIFCDLQMPDMDGVEFIRNMGLLGCSQDVVLVSGEESRTLHAVESVARAYGLKVRGALQKPVSTEQLQSLLKTLDTSHQPAQKPTEPQMTKPYTARELHQAIEQDRLVNVYQPKVSLIDGQLMGAEALVRWNHPVDGTVYPDQFISMAEKSGLIHSLTRRVFINTLQDIHQWADSKIQLQISVNVSMDNLSDYGFPEEVEALLASNHVTKSQISIELTESRLAADERMPLDILTRLRLKGFKLSLDDYGTGHSSLSHLRDLPFDEMKFDRSFIHGVARDRTLAVMLRSNIEMAKDLGLSTVAEGVENIDDWNFLRECGIDQAQGYLIAKPMLAGALLEWLADWQSRLPALLTSQTGG